ncbi:MAG: beta strand repeat-containing protein, partial [Janthinobacterium lividum]
MCRASRTPFFRCGIIAAFFSVLALAGCGVETIESGTTVLNPGNLTISGHVHGGAYPIQAATINLMETQVTAAGTVAATGATVPASTYGTAVGTAGSTAKLLTSTKSDKYGYFNFTNYAGCDSGQYVYAVVTGGQTITGMTNNNVIQVGVIGLCDTALANPGKVNIFVSELSTVAAAYALNDFIGISPNDASGNQVVNINAPIKNAGTGACKGTGNSGKSAMTCTAAGLANGFNNAINLVDSVRFDGSFPTGQANSTFVLTTNTQAVVPQALINNLGNILQSCVDSAGVANSSPSCNSLFTAATPPSYTGASTPQNTLQVALNMAMYPTNNVDALFLLKPANPFFTPDLVTDTWSGTSCPAGASGVAGSATYCANYINYSLSVFYTGTGIKNAAGNTEAIGNAVDIALDAADNAYVLITGTTGTAYGALDGFAPNGTGLFLGTHQTSLAAASGIALDNLSNAWVTNDAASGNAYGLSTATANGGSILQTLAITGGYPAGVTVDLSNNVWVSRDSADSGQSLFRFVPATSNGTTTYSATSFNTTPKIGASVTRLQMDYAQNLFTVTNTTGTPGNATASGVATIEGLPFGTNGAAATLISVPLGATGGGALAVGMATSPNGGGQAYLPLMNEVDSASGTTNSLASGTAGTATGITASTIPNGAAIDSAGTLYWSSNSSAGQVFALTQATGNGASSSTSLTGGHMISLAPCFVVAQKCHTQPSGNYLRGMAIDSSGAMWYVSNATDYKVVQTLGLAAPNWPLLA